MKGVRAPTKKNLFTWASSLKTQVNSVSDRMKHTLAGGAGGVSRDFYNLLTSIGEAKSKQEEARIITAQIHTLKSLFSSNPPKEKMKEYLLRLIYCEMLGHEVEFGYVHALNLTQSSNLLEKKVGYLAVMTFLHKDHPLMIMVVNSFRRDLQSNNYLEVCTALTAMGRLLTDETVPAVVEIVITLLDHPKEAVRKKAVVVLHRCWRLQPDSLNSVMDRVRKALCDKNPSVMAVALIMFDEMVHTTGPHKYVDLIPSFVSILKQVIEHRLPSGYDYHRIPAPWIQIQLLRLLAVLAGGDATRSENVYQILKDTMKRADVGIHIGMAVLYECIRTAGLLYPNKSVLTQALSYIPQFLSAEGEHLNLRCIGVNALAMLVKVQQSFASEYQVQLLECLDNPDETLQHATLSLLHLMTNRRNVVSISDKMIKALARATEKQVKREMIQRITQSAEKYAPSFQWYVNTFKAVLQVGDTCVDTPIVHQFYYKLLELSKQGIGGSQSATGGDFSATQMQLYATESFYNTLRETHCSDTMVQVSCWLIGEFATLSSVWSVSQLIVELSTLLENPNMTGTSRTVIIDALLKLLPHAPDLIDDVREVITLQAHARSLDCQQRAYEAIALLQLGNVEWLSLARVSANDYSASAIDSTLSFTDEYVQEALQYGALPYLMPSEREPDALLHSESESASSTHLRFQEYPAPESDYSSIQLVPPSLAPTPAAPLDTLASPFVNSSTQKGSVWSAQGYTGGVGVTDAERMEDSRKKASSFQSAFPSSNSSKYASMRKESTPTSDINSSASSTTTTAKSSTATNTPNNDSVIKKKKKEKKAAALFGFDDPNEHSSVSPMFSPPPPRSSPHTSLPSSPSSHSQAHLSSHPTHQDNTNSNINNNSSRSVPNVGAPKWQPPVAIQNPDAQQIAAVGPSASAPTHSQLLFQPATPPPMVTPSTPIIDLLSGLSLDSPPVSTQTSTAPPPRTTTPSTNTSSSPIQSNISSTSNNSTNSGLSLSANYSATLQQAIGSNRLSHCPPAFLVGDSNVHLLYFIIWKQQPARPFLVLLFSNQTSRPIESLTGTLRFSKNLSVSFTADDSVTIPEKTDPASDSVSFSVESLQAHAPAAVICDCVLDNYSYNISVIISFSHASTKSTDPLQATIPLHICDFIRPLAMNVKTFGEQWKAAKSHYKLDFPLHSFTSAANLNFSFEKHLNMQPIQVIENEAISAATIKDQTILIHAKISASQLQILIRVQSDTVLCQLLSRTLHQYVTNTGRKN